MGVRLGHDSRIAGGVLVVSVVNGELKEVCSAKVRNLGEKVGQAWRLHVHLQDSTKAAYVKRYPPHIAQYRFEIASQRGYLTHSALFSCGAAQVSLRYPFGGGWGYRTSTLHALYGGKAQKGGVIALNWSC